MTWWRFFATLDSTKLLFREILLAGGMIVVLIAALYAHTGNMPPLWSSPRAWFMIQMAR